MNKSNLQKLIIADEINNDVCIGIYVHSPGTKTFSYNSKTTFSAASIIKIALALNIRAKVLSGRLSYTEKVLCTKQDISIPADNFLLHEGTWYSFRDVIWNLLAYSDNTAQNMLSRFVSSTEMSDFLIDILHLSDTTFIPLKDSTDNNYSSTTPKDIAMLLQCVIGIIDKQDVFAQNISRALQKNTQTDYYNFLSEHLYTDDTSIYLKHGALKNAYNIAFLKKTKKNYSLVSICVLQKQDTQLKKPLYEMAQNILRGTLHNPFEDD